MNKELAIERTFKDDYFVVAYEKGILKDYEKRVLAGRELDNILRMRFITSENQDTVYYNIAGYTPLRNVILQNFFEAIGIVESLLTVLIKAEDYLIDIGNICMDFGWIYYDLNKKNIHLAYLPREEIPGWQELIYKFVVELAIIYDSKEAQPYFESLKNYMEGSQRTLQDLFIKVCDLKREAHLSMGSI